MIDEFRPRRMRSALRLMTVLLVVALAGVGGPLMTTGMLAAPAAAQDDGDDPKTDEDDSRPRIGREGDDEETPVTEEDDAEPTEADGTYESPTYGYRIDYDPAVWQIQSEDDNPDDPYDRIVFTNQVSVLGIFGDPDYQPNQLDRCVGDYVLGFEDEDGVSEIEPLDEPDATGDEEERYWETYTYVYTFEDGTEEEFTRYFECVALGDELSLVIIHDVPSGDFADEVEAREDLLGGFDMGSGPAEEPSDEPTEEATAEPTDGGVYESPQYGYQLTFDPAVWEIIGEDDDPDDPYDRVSLSNGVSTFTFFGDPDYTADELDRCVADYASGMETNENISEIEPLDEPDAEGAEDGRSWATYTYIFTSTNGDETPYTRYFECRSLSDDLTFVSVQTVPTEEYANEIPAREDLLAGLDAGSGPAPTEDESPTPARTDDEQALEDAIEIIPVTDASHTDETVDYEQTPPVGGPHNDVPQDCGFYDEPIINEHAVHSLEHGAVWITYDPNLPADEVAILEDLAAGEPKLLVSPFEGLPSPVVASAWGVQLQLESASDPLLEEFIATYVDGEFAPEPGAACAGTDQSLPGSSFGG